MGFSCKCRHLCPSCHQKRVVEYAQWLLTNVLKAVPHRQWVFSIPKRLRIYFMYDRKLLAKLSTCGWNVINTFL
ncbi:MAG: transposase zinc-binding domain-containing protein, partial [Desulfobacteraceae bacterium]